MPKTMPSVLKSFLPWILFFALFGHSAGSKETATIAAIVSHLIFNHQAIRKKFVLDIGALLFFGFYAVNLFIIKNIVISNYGYVLSSLTLAFIAWLSILIKRPFTLQYARLTTAVEVNTSPLFLFINYTLTALWAALLTLMALPNLSEVYDPVKHAGDINIGLSIVLMMIGLWLTNQLPDRIANRMVEKKFNVNIKKLYADEHMAPIDYSEFNVESLSESRDFDTDVIIIGAGPIGLAAGLLLQQYGIKTIIVEKHQGTSIHPKARAISCRSMELLRKLGINEKLVPYHLPRAQRWFGWFTNLKGKVYARIDDNTDYPSISPVEAGSASQHYLERAMLEQLQNLNVDVLFEHELVDFSQDEDRVQVKIKQLKVDREKILQAKYMIAADGADSYIRESLKIPMIGPDEISVNFSVYCEIDLTQVLEEKKRFGVAFMLRQGRPTPLILSIDGKNKWVFVFPSAGSSVKSMKHLYTDKYIKSQIYELIGNNDIPINIISKQVWSLGSQVANQFIAGRTILAGDSIHRFSPTGGMGMNTGLQDVDNLIWKLAYVIQEKVDPSVIKSYSKERVSPILDNMQWSLNNLLRIVHIQSSFEKAELEDINFQDNIKEQESHLNKSGLDLGVIYSSKIIAKTDDPKPIIETDNYLPTTYPGARLPHIELIANEREISSLDLIETEFILLCLEEGNHLASIIDFKSIPTKIIYLNKQGGIYETYKGAFAKLVGLGELSALWVRPDGHIAWRGCLNKKSDLRELDKIIDLMRFHT